MVNYIAPSGIDRMGYVPVGPPYGYSSRAYQTVSIPITLSNRSLVSSEYPVHCESDSPVESYGLQSTPLSAHDLYNGLYTMHDGGRNYTQASHRLPPTYNAYGEQETSPTYSTSPLPYSAPATGRQTLSATDSASNSFNVVSLQYSLPNAAPDRILPNPMPNSTTRSHYASSSSTNAINNRPSGANMTGISHHGLPLVYSNSKPHASWMTEPAASETRSDSIPSVASTDLIAPPPSKASTTTSSSSTSEGSPSSCVPSGSPEASPTNPQSSYSSSPAYSSTPASTSTRSLVSASSSGNLRRSSTAPSNDGLILAHQSSQANLNLYSYSSDSTPRGNSVNEPPSEKGLLVNGALYAPLAQPHPDRIANINNFQHETYEPRHAIHHRSSAHSINQSS
jgi:hypothetical protein